MRLIDADALKKYIDMQIGRPFIGCTVGEALKMMTDEQPTIETEPKAVNYICTGYADGQPVYDEAECPCCGSIYEEGDMAWQKAKYCMDCGQPLLWQEEEE